ncbi:MAG TPA: His-Xaa-Ser system radical SAM maturase HxsB [Elusimicrobia bacterium]|nr:His-Xaa-Ser system radical SAM maturase HxsB [Elusimicrobiota bacterium]
MAQNLLKIKTKNSVAQTNPPHFYWREVDGAYLISNDSGCHAWLDAAAFKRFSAGTLREKDKAFEELSSKGFIRDRLDFADLAAKWKSKNSHLSCGPGLHIFVMTLRCDHKCLYCQSGAISLSAKGADMKWPAAKKSVDFAFQTTAPGLTIEFQGGEPLLNWAVLKKTVSYARKKEKLSGKRLNLGLVSNFSRMTEGYARFLLENEVSLCTSLDGPADLHNRNRICSGGNAHVSVRKWLRYFTRRNTGQGAGYRIFKPSALLTVTKFSLGRAPEIIDEYAGLGLEDVFIRPLSPIGYAKNSWSAIGYTAADFVAFYKESLGYILKLNRKGAVIREKMAAMLLEKIIGFSDPGYLDMRCPCGAAVGQIAYNYNGDLYTCDEGRMAAWEGDDLFKIGNVFRDSYKKAVSCSTARSCVAASELHLQPACSRCAYSPYCGVCPVYNYEAQGSLWGNMPANERCAFMKGIFGILFSKLKNSKDREILQKWVKK